MIESDKIKSIEELLDKLSNAEAKYLNAKKVLKGEKARLNMETDWKAEFPDKSRITEGDKKDWITLEVSDLQEDCYVAEAGYHYMKELWELQKLIIRIQGSDKIENGLDRIKGELEGIGCHLELLRKEFSEEDIHGAIENVGIEIQSQWSHIQQVGADIEGVRYELNYLRKDLNENED